MERQIATMKIQDELKCRIALLTAEGEIEKVKAVDEHYETSEYSKHHIKAQLTPFLLRKSLRLDQTLRMAASS